MGTIADRAFRFMLGWLRGAVAAVWNALNGGAGNTGIVWAAQHWKTLALALILTGTLIDVIIYLIRWRPDRVWRSFFRRLAGKKRLEPLEEQRVPETWPEPPEAFQATETEQKAWIYADGVTQSNVRDPEYSEQPEYIESSRTVLKDAEAARPETSAWMNTVTESAAPVLTPRAEARAAADPGEPKAGENKAWKTFRTGRMESLSSIRERTNVRRLLGLEDDEDELISYRPARPDVRAESAYHPAVYPARRAEPGERRRRRSDTGRSD